MPIQNFTICKYSCKEGLSGVPMQDNQGISFESRKLKKYEDDYVTSDLELIAITHALNKWGHYLMGRKFI